MHGAMGAMGTREAPTWMLGGSVTMSKRLEAVRVIGRCMCLSGCPFTCNPHPCANSMLR